MPEHATAIKMLRESKLSKSDKRDLYEMYLEECEERSVNAAIDTLQSDIRDLEGREG